MAVNIFVDSYGGNVIGAVADGKKLLEYRVEKKNKTVTIGSVFKGTVEKEDRSLMNVPFITGNADIDAKFIKEATAAGFVNLKGHRSVGGMRASIYNAMPEEGVSALIDFMAKFEKEN